MMKQINPFVAFALFFTSIVCFWTAANMKSEDNSPRPEFEKYYKF